MGWKEFYDASTHVHYFADQNCPEFWVRLKHLDSLEWGRAKAYMKEDISDDEAVREAEELLKDAILEWNIPDPHNPGRILPLPKDDPSVLDRLPNAFIMQMQAWMMEGMNVDELVPTMREKPSAPPS